MASLGSQCPRWVGVPALLAWSGWWGLAALGVGGPPGAAQASPVGAPAAARSGLPEPPAPAAPQPTAGEPTPGDPEIYDPLAPDPISRELAALADRQARDLKRLLDLETDPTSGDTLRLRLAGLLFRRAVEFQSDSVLLRTRDAVRAELYAQRAVADEQTAEELLRAVLAGDRDDPSRTEALERLARMLIRRADEARDRGQTAVGIREEAVDLLAALAPRIADKQGRVSALRVQAEQLLSLDGRAQRQRAAEVIREALALDPESGAERVRIYSLAGRAAEELDDAGDALGLYVTTLREAGNERRTDAVLRAEQGLVRTLGRMGDLTLAERILDDVGPAATRLRPSVAVSLADNGHGPLALSVLERGLRLARDAEDRRELRLLHLRVAAQADARDAVATDLQALRSLVPAATAVAPPEWARAVSEVLQAALRARWAETPWPPEDEARALQAAARFPLGTADQLRLLLLEELVASPTADCDARLGRQRALRTAFRAAPAVTDRAGEGRTRDLGFEAAARSLNHLLACRPTGDGTPPRPLLLPDDDVNILFFKEITANHPGLAVSVDLARGEQRAAADDVDGALEAFERALKVDGLHVPATAERVVALLLDRRDWDAATRRADALAEDPRLDAATREQMLHVADQAALAQIAQGEPGGRGPALARFIAERPASPLLPNARLALAEVFTAEGDHGQAEAVLREAAQAGGPSRAARQATARLAEWHLARGDAAEAARWQGRLAVLVRAGGAGTGAVELLAVGPGRAPGAEAAPGKGASAAAPLASVGSTVADLLAAESAWRRQPPPEDDGLSTPPAAVLATWAAEARLWHQPELAERWAARAEAAGLPDGRWAPVVAWIGRCDGPQPSRRGAAARSGRSAAGAKAGAAGGADPADFDPSPWVPRLRAACAVAAWEARAEALLAPASAEGAEDAEALAARAQALHALVTAGPESFLGAEASPETRVRAWLLQARLGEALAAAMLQLAVDLPELGPQGEAWRVQARGLWREMQAAVRAAAGQGSDRSTLLVLDRWLGASLHHLAGLDAPSAPPVRWGLP